MATLTLIGILVIVACAIAFTGAYRSIEWGPRIWWAWTVIAGLRVAAVWLLYLGLQTSGWFQLVYILHPMILPEAILVRSLRFSGAVWAASLSVLVAVGSLAWAIILVSLLEAMRGMLRQPRAG